MVGRSRRPAGSLSIRWSTRSGATLRALRVRHRKSRDRTQIASSLPEVRHAERRAIEPKSQGPSREPAVAGRRAIEANPRGPAPAVMITERRAIEANSRGLTPAFEIAERRAIEANSPWPDGSGGVSQVIRLQRVRAMGGLGCRSRRGANEPKWPYPHSGDRSAEGVRTRPIRLRVLPIGIPVEIARTKPIRRGEFTVRIPVEGAQSKPIREEVEGRREGLETRERTRIAWADHSDRGGACELN